MIIRPETSRDHEKIRDLTQRAFAPMPFADDNDQHIPSRLRDAGALSLSLVMEHDDKIIGHVAISPVTHESGATGWYGLGPIAVELGLQRRGIGTALIAEAKRWLVEQNAQGCIVLGDTAYYPRHGFMPAPAHAPQGEPEQHFMIWALAPIPSGRFAFHSAFYA